MASDTKGYYKFLNIPPGSPISEIRKAYMRMQRECNIDNPKVKQQLKSITDESKRKALEKEYSDRAAKLNEIKCVLLDEKEKEKYDAGMTDTGFNFDFGSSIFDFFGGGGRRKAESTVSEIRISAKEAYTGVSKKFKVKRRVKCKTCNGRGGTNVSACSTCRGTGKVMRQSITGTMRLIEEGVCPGCHGEKNVIRGDRCSSCRGAKLVMSEETVNVDIPPGVSNGQQLMMSGLGDEMENGLTGDLVFVVEIAGDVVRVGNDIVDYVDMDIYTALVGGTIHYRHLDGKVLDIPIQAKKIFENESVCVRGKGFEFQGRRGDLYLRPRIKVNSSIDAAKLREVLPPIINATSSGTTVSATYRNLPQEKKKERVRENIGETFFRNFGFF